MRQVTQARTKERLTVETADVVGSVFKVRYDNRDFVVTSAGNKIEVFEPEKPQPLGSIRRGSSWSGAIWRTGECIAEYAQEPTKEYVVIPIQRGRKQQEKATSLDPLVYLLGYLSSES